MIARRAADKWEQIFHNTHESIQMAIQFESAQNFDKILDRLNKYCPGLHYGSDGKYIFKTNNKVSVYKLPDQYNNLAELSNLMFFKHTQPLDQSLMQIGINKDAMVLNINHIASDGMFLHKIFDVIKSEDEITTIPQIVATEKQFEKEIKEYTGRKIPFFSVDHSLTRIHPKIKQEFHSNMKSANNLSYTDSKNLMTTKINGKVSQMTENFWISVILSTFAFNDKIDKAGACTMVNLRPFLQSFKDTEVTCSFSSVAVTSDVSESMEVSELMKSLRKNFEERIKNKEYIGFIKSLPDENTIFDTFLGLGLDISLIQKFKLNDKMNDLYIGLNEADFGFSDLLSITGYSVEKDGTNKIMSNVKFSPTTLGELEGKVLSRSIIFGLESIHPDMTVKKAVELLQEYQNGLQKTLESPIIKYLD
ncbi:hypothetical protein TVAG_102740 [Trichomonas vaginalis G3]|uniref:Condensation domain-containing protein n=1 Tax=Trichomonas vaginalis (strain ATCC PRA-98 / G3) TaxID=412133 RepID=A2ECY0_TRIV3|nr:hypothetical protein TVAGG3_0757750 [Trichomonas vaginalis G3]EAY09525.1 hypothetical protein TVAG_102740 [Trichomonas vaginalis G3]KAI5512986.1 hypothetical protein TVAGG3_0757750 [Trichomonas vaginalis G3]|eukprot:XP_001321748.1 hypothetical protein [Trichomonas vaginalis G3]